MRKQSVWCCLILLTLCAAASWAQTGYVVDYRSTLGSAQDVAVNPNDGTLWVAEYLEVSHMTADGTPIQRVPGFLYPYSIAVNPTDGSVWVADSGNMQLVHLSPSGQELWHGGSFLVLPSQVAVDPGDGSVWAVDLSHSLLHFAADGTELWHQDINNLYTICLDSNSACWAACGTVVRRFAPDGTELPGLDPSVAAAMPCPIVVAVAPNGSSWLLSQNILAHVTSEGMLDWSKTGALGWGLAVDPSDGSAWVSTADTLTHLAPDGSTISQLSPLPYAAYRIYYAFGVSPNLHLQVAGDGSVWMALTNWGVGHAAADGQSVTMVPQLGYQMLHVEMVQKDGSCWVIGNTPSGQHVSRNGEVLFATPETTCWKACVYQANGSCWLGYTGGVVRYAGDGTELARVSNITVQDLSLDQSDGSIWTLNSTEQRTHWLADGTQVETITTPLSFAEVDPSDHSLWIIASAAPPFSPTSPNSVFHVADDGTILSQLDGTGWLTTVLPVSGGGCWVSGFDQAFRVTADGKLAASKQFDSPVAVIATLGDDCWVGYRGLVMLDQDANVVGQAALDIDFKAFDPYSRCGWSVVQGQLVHLSPVGPFFNDMPADNWAYPSVQACASHPIVAGDSYLEVRSNYCGHPRPDGRLHLPCPGGRGMLRS